MHMLRFLSCTLAAMMVVSLAFAQQPDAKAPAAPDKPKSTKQKDRVYVKDIEGLWLPRDYMDALRVTRQPHAATRKAPPVLIKIQKEGPSYPIVRTDFTKAVLEQVLDIEPVGKPGSYRIAAAADASRAVPVDEVTYIPFRGEKGVEGKFDSLAIADPTFSKGRFRDYLRIRDSLVVFVNRAVLAGKYVDDQGRAYEFSEAGQATFPDTTFDYEVSLAAAGAGCEYFETADDKAPGGHRRYGFAWKGDRLQLFNATGAEPKNVRCDKKPFAVLKLQG
jgi:hypothetical protein